MRTKTAKADAHFHPSRHIYDWSEHDILHEW